MEETKQDVVLYKFHELIVNQNKLSLSLCDFFEIADFDPSQFFDSSFWCALNSLEDDEWFEVSDDIIELIGYKGTVANGTGRTDGTPPLLLPHFSSFFHFDFNKAIVTINGKIVHITRASMLTNN